jgi:hypothetical protein
MNVKNTAFKNTINVISNNYYTWLKSQIVNIVFLPLIFILGYTTFYSGVVEDIILVYLYIVFYQLVYSILVKQDLLSESVITLITLIFLILIDSTLATQKNVIPLKELMFLLICVSLCLFFNIKSKNKIFAKAFVISIIYSAINSIIIKNNESISIFIVIASLLIIHELLHVLLYEIIQKNNDYSSTKDIFSLSYEFNFKRKSKKDVFIFLGPTIINLILITILSNIMGYQSYIYLLYFIELVNLAPINGTDLMNYLNYRKEEK